MCTPIRIGKSACQCAGHASGLPGRNDLAILKAHFEPGPAEHKCNCTLRSCPRRLHALTGAMLGAGVILHLAVNALGFWPQTYQRVVDAIHGLGPALPWLEAALIFIPLLIHVAYGLRFLVQSGLKLRVPKHHNGSDYRYLGQRITAAVLLAFLVFHIGTFHRWGLHALYRVTQMPALERYASGGLFQPQGRAFESSTSAIRFLWRGQAPDSAANLAVVGLYFAGLLALVYHLTNGAATGAEVWGWARTRQARQKLWEWCLVPGLALLILGAAGWYVFALGLHY